MSVRELILSYLNKLGVNSKILWVQLVTLGNLIKGPLVLLFMGLTISSEIQGYWFSFVSLGALISLADLGFTTILSQYISHNAHSIKITSERKFIETPTNVDIFIFILSALKFYFYMIVIIIPVMIAAGFWYFSEFEYLLPWITYTVVGALFLLLSFIQSVIIGFNEVEQVNKEKLFSIFSVTFVTIAMLVSGFDIWALVGGYFAGTVVGGAYHYRNNSQLWGQILKNGYNHVSIKNLKPVLGLQTKYAISWLCGYLIFQLYVPVIFKTHGAVLAGQVGLTIAAFSAINQFSNSFISASTPRIGQLAGQNNEKKALQLFVRSLYKRCFCYLLLAILAMFVFISMGYFDYFLGLSEKFLPNSIKIMLAIMFFSIGLISNLATYCRSHKEENFTVHAIFNSLGVVLSIAVFYENIDNLFLSVSSFYLFILVPTGFYTNRIF